MKNIKKYIILLVLSIGSFYMTNNTIMTMINKDAIMKQIDKNSKKYNIEAENAIITEKNIIPGVNGQTVDRQKSYHQMKKYGNYNETMTVLKEVTPEISISSYYDKYIEEGNHNKRRIALVFPIQQVKILKQLLPLLEKEEIEGTIFIDGNDIDELISDIKKYKKNEYELLSFNHEYNSYYLKTAESYLENITKKEVNYCYTEKENSDLLEYCIKNKHHTIKPKFVISDNLTYQVKKKLENGLIISVKLSEQNASELRPMIQYIKQRGYQFERLNELLKE